jgi:cytochrome c-type biogenesis protein CcmH
LALVLALFVIPVAAQDDAGAITDDEVNEIAKEVYCPVCENTPLDVCQTQACADWRELIRTKLSEGQTRDEIFEYFARQYGDGVLANPPRRGMSLVMLWVLPVVLFLIGLLFFARYVRGLRTTGTEVVATAGYETRQEAPAEQPDPPAQDEYLARVEEELSKSDE